MVLNISQENMGHLGYNHMGNYSQGKVGFSTTKNFSDLLIILEEYKLKTISFQIVFTVNFLDNPVFRWVFIL